MRAAFLALTTALALTACSSGPGGALRGADGGPGMAPSSFEQAQVQRAQEQVKDGQLAEAAWTWEALTVLRPDNATYRDSLAATRQLIDSGVAERIEKAKAAHKRGDLEGATTQYLGALALQPDNEPAADALRAIERERNQKTYLGKPARLTLRKAAPPVAAKTAPKAQAATGAKDKDPTQVAAATGGDRNELEHVAMLAAQGELDEPIRLLERRAPQDRNDPSAKRLLADLYVRKAEKISAIDKPGAVMLLQKCLRVDPRNARATALMRQLIDESAAKAPAAGPAATAKNKVEKR
ncbi:tetratricopeptide repeat protein [Roseateles sp. MS654]|uniref:tetratricopeptide repeat protein n=1 Tax=Roseateles sp. MS654 TaxID=3412685 RepID=UPI003C2CAF26